MSKGDVGPWQRLAGLSVIRQRHTGQAAVMDAVVIRRDHETMTKADPDAAIPPFDAGARRRLSAALDRPPVVSGLLFGSQARGTAGPLSDVDVAVWFEPGSTASERFQAQIEVTSAAADALATGEVQVVVLNEATPLLRHRAMRDGIRLLDRDRKTRIRLETRAMLEYLDTAPLRATLARGLRHRIEEDRFGRS